MSSTVDTIGPKGGAVATVGFEVSFIGRHFDKATEVRLTHRMDPLERKYLVTELRHSQAPVSLHTYSISASNAPMSDLGVKIRLPDDLESSVGSEWRPATLIEIFGCEHIEYVGLPTTYDPVTRLITATVGKELGLAVNCDEESEAKVTSESRNAPVFSAMIKVYLERNH